MWIALLTSIMGGFYSEEYHDLVAAQRVLSLCMGKSDIEPRDAAMVASALTRIVDQKRVMRGQPAPKPSEDPKGRKSKQPRSSPLPIDPSASGPGK